MVGLPRVSSTPQHGTMPTNILVSFWQCCCSFVRKNILAVVTRGAWFYGGKIVKRR